MSLRHGFLTLLAAAVVAPGTAHAISIEDISRVEMIAPRIVELAATAPYDYCLKGSDGSVLRFNSDTGDYVVCGSNGLFEQGQGVVAKAGGMITLVHSFASGALQGQRSLSASVDVGTGIGHANVYASNETNGQFTAAGIEDPNVNDGSDCSQCNARSAVREGVINAGVTPSHAISLGTTVTDVTFLQQFSFNSDFDGQITELTAGLTRIGAGPLAFQFTVYTDQSGRPGVPIYTSGILNFPTFPASPAIGLVHVGVEIRTGSTFWAGYRWDPATNPLGAVYGTDVAAALSKVYFCEPDKACHSVTDISQFSALRGLSISAEYRHPGIEASGGLVRYGFDSTDIISEKCDDSYRRLDIGSFGIVQLYAEYPGPFKPTNYSSAFARISPVTAVTGTGIYGIARSTYGTMKVSAFSYIGGSQAEVCTRPEDKTDFVCHAISGYTAGTCDDTTLVGVKLGFEFGCANAPADWIDRRFIQYNGSEWTSQPLNPVKGLPSIGSSRFGFPRYVASGSKLGVAYEYELTSGTIQTQLTNGNSIVGTYTIGTDIPPQGFNPSLATRMAGDCTRAGVCAFGRYQAASKSNFVDLIDFRESPPEINTWRLGSSPSGFDFGRAVNINGRDGTALYASYTTSPTPDQNRLQLDYIDLKKYQKFTLAFDYAAGAGKYPLSLSREGGDWGLGHARGVDLIYSLTEGCKPARIGGHSTGNDSGTSHPAFPCENVIPIHSRF